MLAVPYMSPETRLIFLPDAENRTIVSSFVWTKHRNVTNRQTDGRNRSGYCGRHFEQYIHFTSPNRRSEKIQIHRPTLTHTNMQCNSDVL